MKYLILAFSVLFLSSCAVAGTIFKGGMGVGIIICVVVIVVLYAIFGGRKNN
jgi:hypothetical protein